MNTIKINDNDWVEIPLDTMPCGFIIICYPCIIADRNELFYELYFGHNAVCNIEINRSQAEVLIKKYNLQLSLDNSDGEIWE
ncbi:MAG: hypothetical protein R3Y50_10565 [Rikenellaceae bacterium]